MYCQSLAELLPKPQQITVSVKKLCAWNMLRFLPQNAFDELAGEDSHTLPGPTTESREGPREEVEGDKRRGWNGEGKWWDKPIAKFCVLSVIRRSVSHTRRWISPIQREIISGCILHSAVTSIRLFPSRRHKLLGEGFRSATLSSICEYVTRRRGWPISVFVSISVICWLLHPRISSQFAPHTHAARDMHQVFIAQLVDSCRSYIVYKLKSFFNIILP